MVFTLKNPKKPVAKKPPFDPSNSYEFTKEEAWEAMGVEAGPAL